MGHDYSTYEINGRTYPLLSHDKEIALAKTIQEGGKEAEYAREVLFNSNLRLVFYIAHKIPSRFLTFSDRVQEGSIGLLRAISRFDPSKGFRFSTYATWWIRSHIVRSIHKEEEIRLPIYQKERQNCVLKTAENLRKYVGREPTVEEIAIGSGMSEEIVREVIDLPVVSISMDKPLSEREDSSRLRDILVDEGAEDPELESIRKDVSDKVGLLIQDLDRRDRIIFHMRFGTDPATLEEIGAKVGLTRERVRQIIRRRMKVLRARAYNLGLE